MRPATFTVVLVSDAFDEVPWLERVHVAAALWDALEMGALPEPTATRRWSSSAAARPRPRSLDATWHGLDLLALI